MEVAGPRLAIVTMLVYVAMLILFPQVHCYNDEEDHLLQGINSFRQSSSVPPLAKHDRANCIADEIADKLESRSCTSSVGPPTQSQLISAYPDVLRKCKVDVNSTSEGVILPVCVPHRVATLVLTNYTQSQNSQYLNNSRYTGAGIGTEDDWTVLVLTTSTPAGSFASIACCWKTVSLSYYVPLLVVFLRVLV